MKAKLLNPLQEMMVRVVSHTCELLAQNCGSASYNTLKEWLCNAVILFALTVDSGNDTYMKTVRLVFNEHIKPQCDCGGGDSHCDHISSLLRDMIALLSA